MAIDYNKISNKALEEQFLKNESLEQLEDILMSCETCGLPDKTTHKKKRKLSKREALEISPEIFSRVDSFLGVEGITPPDIEVYDSFEVWYFNNKNNLKFAASGLIGTTLAADGIFSCIGALANGTGPGIAFLSAEILLSGVFISYATNELNKATKELNKQTKYTHPKFEDHYNVREKRMHIQGDVESMLTVLIAHEYAHHLQEEIIGPRGPDYRFFSEGHARGIERHISNLYAAERNDPWFASKASEHTTGELAAVYLWMCRSKRKMSRAIPVIHQNKGMRLANKYMDYKGMPIPHAFGNTIFYLAEKRHGDGIYADALNGNVDFLFE